MSKSQGSLLTSHICVFGHQKEPEWTWMKRNQAKWTKSLKSGRLGLCKDPADLAQLCPVASKRSHWWPFQGRALGRHLPWEFDDQPICLELQQLYCWVEAKSEPFQRQANEGFEANQVFPFPTGKSATIRRTIWASKQGSSTTINTMVGWLIGIPRVVYIQLFITIL